MSTEHPPLLDELKLALGQIGIRPLSRALEWELARRGKNDARRHVPIVECGEELREISESQYLRHRPHPYLAKGAKYSAFSPYFLRAEVCERLQRAQSTLQILLPGAKFEIFDCYRPLALQRYMVQLEFDRLAVDIPPNENQNETERRAEIFRLVHTVWAEPSEALNCPPPHSTGAAIDLQIVLASGDALPMGTAIDEYSEKNRPNFYAYAVSSEERQLHTNRELLRCAMLEGGFRQLPTEWWHFSYGDQYWALLEWLDDALSCPIARYGRYEIGTG